MENQNYYEEIKGSLIKNEVYKRVKDYSKNRSDLETYYNVGKLLSEAGKHYGEGIIKQYSVKLTNELKKKYSEKLLYKIRQFYQINEKFPAVSGKLTWSHWYEVLAIKDTNEISYYINKCEQQNLSTRKLRELIKSKEYERLPNETKNKLIKKQETNIKDLVLDPIIIENKNNIEIVNEHALHNLILENIIDFMKQLGTGFAFVDTEYKLKIGDRYYYIDLLLINYIFNCFVVVELKTTELKKEYIGQIEIYMNYIDNNLKRIDQDRTIGIIICRRDNKFIMEYCSDRRILSREYKIV